MRKPTFSVLCMLTFVSGVSSACVAKKEFDRAYDVALLSAVSDFSNGTSVRCETIRAGSAARTSVGFGGDTIRVGFNQVSSTNQDAFVRRTGATSWNRTNYDTSSDDSRGELIATNGTDVFVAFSATGGNTGLAAFADGSSVQSSYGRGGGPKVTFLAKIDPANGNISPRGTFIAARLSAASGLRANTVNPCLLEITGPDSVRLTATTAFDGGAASDSLQPGVECASGSTRVITLNFNLTTVQSVECR